VQNGNHNSNKATNFIFTAWVLIAGLVPLAIYPAKLIVDFNKLTGNHLPVSSSVPPPEMVWIFPKVALLLIFAVIGLAWLRHAFSLETFSALILVYATAIFLSAWLSGDDFQYILLGGNGRMDGLLYSLSLAVFMLVGYFLAKNSLKRILAYFYLAASITGLLEVVVLTAQRLGHDFMGPITRGKAYTDIITGTIGNPGMLGGLLLPIVMLSVGVASSEQFSKKMRYWAATIALVAAVGISLSANKSSFYGLVIVLAVYLFFHRKAVTLALTTAIVAVMIIAPQAIPNKTTYDHPLIPTASFATRPALWKLSLKAIRATPGQPFLGAGPDGLRLIVLKKELIEDMLAVYRISEKWPENRKIASIKPVFSAEDPIRSRAYAVTFSDNKLGNLYRANLDKAHNLFLDRALASGILSAVIWMILYLFPVFKLFKRGDALSTAIACSLSALFLYYLFWFPVPQVEPVHAGLLAIAWGMAYHNGSPRRQHWGLTS